MNIKDFKVNFSTQLCVTNIFGKNGKNKDGEALKSWVFPVYPVYYFESLMTRFL